MKWSREIAIVAGCALIAASILFTNRWEISATSYGYMEGNKATTSEVVYRLDRWTGEIRSCGLNINADLMERASKDGAMVASCEYPPIARPHAQGSE
jgi:hypothetical protein